MHKKSPRVKPLATQLAAVIESIALIVGMSGGTAQAATGGALRIR